MLKIQQALLILLACFYILAVDAQTHVNVIINGIDKHLEDNVRLFLSIEQQKDHSLLSEARLRRLHKKSSQEISRALQPFGFYRPKIEPELTELSQGNWQATYVINPGPALPVAEFNFTISDEMKQDIEFQKLLQALPLQKDEAFSHLIYEDFKASLAKLASERGYFKARFIEHEIEINLNAYEARIRLNYDGGPRYYFGEILLQQNVLDAELLQRYIPFERGDAYTLKELIDLQQALNDSDYFRTVEISPGQPQTDTHEIPISVKLMPRKRHRYSFGIGYGSDTGARAKFGWEIPRLNSKGHRFNTETKVSELGYSVGAHYRVPVFNPRTDQMIYSAGVVNEKTDSSESTIRTIGASLKISQGAWRETFSLNYQQEDFIVGDDRGDSTLLMPGINWSRTWGNNFIYAIDGLRFDIGLRGASNNIVSDTRFFQFQGGIKAITSINPYNRIISRGNLGSTRTDEFELLPSSVRFFAGGGNSVRGYAYQSLGPLDSKGQVIGGKHLMVGSIEFEHRFSEKWGLALFYDGGNAIDNFDDKLERGAGIGFRWKSPVGSVRIDLASALTRDGQPWRIHINIGPDL